MGIYMILFPGFNFCSTDSASGRWVLKNMKIVNLSSALVFLHLVVGLV
jgi:hypothetical protein